MNTPSKWLHITCAAVLCLWVLFIFGSWMLAPWAFFGSLLWIVAFLPCILVFRETLYESSPANKILLVFELCCQLSVITWAVTSVFVHVDHGSPKSGCASNLNQFGKAIASYCADYNDVLPSSKVYSGAKNWNEKDFTEFARPSNSKKSWPVFLYAYIERWGGKDQSSVYTCPLDPNEEENAPGSYFWKAAVDTAWYQGFKKKADYKYPGKQGLIYEGNSWHKDGGERGLTDGAYINMLSMDGHVKFVQIKSSGYTINENPPAILPKSGVGEPAWFNKSDKPNSRPTIGKLFDPKHCYDEF